MLIGIISDTHDHLDNISRAVDIFNACGVDLVIHSGDYCTTFALGKFSSLKARLKGVFGNCDSETRGLEEVAKENNFLITPPPLRLNLGGKSILVYHKLPQSPFIKENEADFIIFGHTHQPLIKEGNPFLINPGEASGLLTQRATIALLHLEEGEARIIDLGNQKIRNWGKNFPQWGDRE